ncbi:MAG TPA: DegT/DnrJ/EryC1/StrS family aminotransferase [Myxococcaceae bacterium]|nr:DegT/DnrJ/EryC1/StrS family aminotransferase [Myxococcaceae bacterium]
MARSRPYVPAEPTLGWEQLRATPRPRTEHPFSADAVTWTHLGRGALQLAARVLRLESREVLVPAYHQGVEIDALLAAGAHPAFYPVGTRWTVDLDDLEKRIGPRTACVVVTHFAGFPGPVRQLRGLADRRGLMLIEDCAQALLSVDGDRPLGTTGDAAVFSLRRSLPVPHGGALVFNGRRGYQLPPLARPPTAATLRALWKRFRGRWLPARFGTGRGETRRRTRRDPLGLGVSPLVDRIARAHEPPRIVERRRRNFFHLLGALRNAAPPLVAELSPGVCPLFYPLWVPDRDEVLARLRAENVEAGEGWPSFHPRCDGAEFPDAARLRQHVVELPCHQDLGPAQVTHVAQVALRALTRDRPRRSRAAEG